MDSDSCFILLFLSDLRVEVIHDYFEVVVVFISLLCY